LLALAPVESLASPLHGDRQVLSSIDDHLLCVVVGGDVGTVGRWLGLKLGTAVTRALWFSPKYRAQVEGMPLGFQERNKPLVGPWLAEKVPSWPEQLQGFGRGLAGGATDAPGWSYYTRFYQSK
jgi:hypothetical protein